VFAHSQIQLSIGNLEETRKHMKETKLSRYIMKVGLVLFLIGTSIFVISCYTVPETGRSGFNVVGSAEELRLGLSAFDEIKRKEKEVTGTADAAMVQRVGRRIANIADKNIPNARWEFVLFENDEANAFALPGGKVGVYTGILPVTKSEAGLATVLSHEIAHVAAHHAGERISQQMVLSGVGTAAAIGFGESKYRQAILMGLGIGGTLGVALPFSRMQESEADRIGLMWMARAGYPPQEAVEFWKRFQEYNQKKGGGPPVFLSTHPADNKRIQDLQNLVPEAEVYYKTSGKSKK
jgi:metalloendopeptidase OMA1, mitochondrial